MTFLKELRGDLLVDALTFHQKVVTHPLGLIFFGGSRRTLGFDSLGGCQPLSSWWELFIAQTKRPLGFQEKVMHISWSFLVSLRMKIGKWPFEHAILIDYLCQVN